MCPPQCYAEGRLGGEVLHGAARVAVAYTKATRATLRCAQDVFDLPLWNGICIPQLQETAHKMPEDFLPSAVAANVPHSSQQIHGTNASTGGNRPLHMSPTCPFRRMVCTGHYTSLLLVLFCGCSAQPLTHLSYLSFSADGLHSPLHMSPICPFRRMVGTGHYTSLLLVLFGAWSAQAMTQVSYLSFSAHGMHRRLHISPTCPFRRMVCTALVLVLFGESTAQAFTHLSYLSFSADGLHSSPSCPFRWMVCTAIANLSYLTFSDGLHTPLQISPTCPFRRMVCTAHYTCVS